MIMLNATNKDWKPIRSSSSSRKLTPESERRGKEEEKVAEYS